MTSLNSESLAELMAEFEAKNGPVETTPVDFRDRQAKSAWTQREESYAQVQEAKARREAKPKSEQRAKVLQPAKAVRPTVVTERDRRIERLANLLGVTSKQIVEAAKEVGLQMRSYTKKGEKEN